MRSFIVAFAGAVGLATVAVSASAAPAVPNLKPQQASNIVQVADGCGRGFHRTRWGRCIPFHYGYRYRPYWRHVYYGPGPGWPGGAPNT